MTVTCKLCGNLLKSYQLSKETALQEVSMLIVRHIQAQHQDMARKIVASHVMLLQVIPWFLMMRRHIQWSPQEEEFVEHNFRTWEKKIAEILEFDVKNSSPKLEIVQ